MNIPLEPNELPHTLRRVDSVAQLGKFEESAHDDASCFHCLEDIPAFTHVTATIAGAKRPVCCIGCKVAAEYIDHQGLGQFYEHRSRLKQGDFFGNITKGDGDKQHWHFLDNAELASRYVTSNAQQQRELMVIVPGLYCSSCSWLITKALASVTEELTVSIDVSSKRVYLLVHQPQQSLAALLEVIERLGYESIVPELGDEFASAQAARQEQQQSLKRVLVAGLGMMQVMTYAIATYLGMANDMSLEHHRFLVLVSMLVATLVVFYSGKLFLSNAINDLRNKHLGMDVPIALAIVGAYFPSVYLTLSHTPGHVYFDSVVMFIFFLLLGRHIELCARHRLTGSGSDVQRLLPAEIWVDRCDHDGSGRVAIKPNQVEVGDQMQLTAGDIVPFDAVILAVRAGQSCAVDESLVSGESLPVRKTRQSSVLAGSRLLQGEITISAAQTWASSSMAKVERLLKTANVATQKDAAKTQAFGVYFIAFVLILTGLVALAWSFYQPERVFDISLAMLIASCPCAFSLAVPMARSAAIHALRKVGILLANHQVLDHLPSSAVWCFDKTGTLSKGEPEIVQMVAFADVPEKNCLSLAAAISQESSHVLANAFSNNEALYNASEITEKIGCGVQAQIGKRQYFLGKSSWVMQHTKSNPTQELQYQQYMAVSQNQPMSEVWLADDEQLLAIFTICDQLRPSAAHLVRQLDQHGDQVRVFSGDKHAAVEQACQTLSIKDFAAELLPQEKQARVAALQEAGHRVVMVGDGVNDAPVLAQADISIAMASGSEISQNNADIILINGELDRLSLLKRIAIKVQNITQQNLCWALLYNVAVLPLAAFGYLTPWLAALGMSLSSLLVVLNALRIRGVIDQQQVSKSLFGGV